MTVSKKVRLNCDLSAVLAASADDEIDVSGERFAGMEFVHVGSVASPLQATPEDEHVAAVAVDVHLRGVKRQDCKRALHAASPRIPGRSVRLIASIAVYVQ